MEERKVNGDSKISSTGKNGVTIFLIPFFDIKSSYFKAVIFLPFLLHQIEEKRL
jgi:hypothetical protein